MSKTDSPKNSNSYSLLLKGLSEIEKKPKGSKSTVKEGNTSKETNMNKNKDSRASTTSQKKNSPEKPSDPNEPDRSYGDYFCKICDSHMNSDAMWEAHVTGKRHIKNVNKGENDSKYDDLPDEESAIKYAVRNVKDPIIGLSYIHEIRRKEPNVPPLYNCFLCHASLATPALVIEHVISMKHRMNYIKENSPEQYQLLEATNLKKGTLEPLVLESAIRMEEQDGRGVVKVKQEKMKAPVVTWKRKDSDDDDDLRWKLSKKTKPENKQSTSKSTDTDKRPTVPRSSRDFKDRTYYPDEDTRDSYSRHSSKKRNPSPRRDDHYRSSRYSDRDRDDYDIAVRKFEYERHRSDYSYHASYLEYEARKEDYDARKLEQDKYYSRKDYNLSPPPRHVQISSYSPERVTSNPDVYRGSSKENYPSTHSLQSHDNLLPHEKVMEQPQQSSQLMFQNFLQKIMDLPSDIFLKLVHVKMETMKLSGIEELSLLSKVINEAQKVLHNQLPPEVHAMIAQKAVNKENNERKVMSGLTGLNLSPLPTQSTQVSQQTQKAISNAQTAQSFINELLSSARNSSNASQQRGPENNSFIPAAPPPAIQPSQNVYSNTNNPPQFPNVNASYQTQYPNANQYNASQTNNYASRPAQNHPYNSNQSSTSSNIPGLTPSNIPGLTLPQQGPQSSQTYNNFQNYSSPSSSKNYRY